MAEEQQLIDAAIEATKASYAPYSHFFVGAALQLKDGEIINGCNVENASYGLTVCAERNVLCSAYSQGYRKEDIVAIAVVGSSSKKAISPCGACRQVMHELLAGDTPVILSNLNKSHVKQFTVDELLPYVFDL